MQVASSLEEAAGLRNDSPTDTLLVDQCIALDDPWRFSRFLWSDEHGRQPTVMIFSGHRAEDQAAVLRHAFGAICILSLTRSDEELIETIRSAHATADAPPPVNVALVIPDDGPARVLAAAFDRHGCRARILPDLADVKATFDLSALDIVVINRGIPGALEQLERWTRETPGLTAIVVSDDPNPQLSLQSLRHGASDHLRRPFDDRFLVELALSRRQERLLFRVHSVVDRQASQIRESKLRLRAIVEATTEALILIDRDGIPLSWNKAATDLLQSLCLVTIGSSTPLQAALPARLRREASIGMQALLLKGVPTYAKELKVDFPDGNPQWLAVTATAVRSQAGGVEWVCITVRNTTEHRKAQDEINFRNHALSSITQGVLITDRNFNITFVNDHFEIITGYKRDEALGRNCRFLQGPNTDPATRKTIQRRLSRNEPFSGEILNYRRDGQPFWNRLYISPVFSPETGEVVQFVGIQEDITAQKLADRELEQERRRLQALFQHSLNAILFLNDGGSVVEANPAAIELTGRDLIELRRLTIFELMTSAPQRWGSTDWMKFLERRTHKGEANIERRDGRVLAVEYEVVSGVQHGLHLVVLRDTTERKALQDHMLHQQRMESIGRLASGVAHDLNNILTPILIAPGMLRTRVDDPRSRALLATIEDGARRGASIVRQLLNFSRADAGSRIVTDLQKVAATAIDLFRETSPGSNAITMQPFEGELPVEGNAPQLQQVLLHLILNAHEASAPKRTAIVVSFDRREIGPADLVEMPQGSVGSFVRVTIADQGHGISEPDQDRIFDPFFTTKGFGQGRGLGLSVVMGIISSHGGFTVIRSKVGVGTIASVYLPRVNEPAAPAPAEPELSPAQKPIKVESFGRGRLVHVIDDDENLRSIMRAMLLDIGFRVAVSADPAAGLAQLKAIAPEVSLVVVDLVMPGVTGTQLIEQIRHLYPRLPMLVMTGSNLSETEQQHLLRYARAFVYKPFNKAALIDAIEDAISVDAAPPATDAGVGAAP